MRRSLVAMTILLGATVVEAEPWYRGPHGRNRVLHVSISTALGLGYLASETVLKPGLAPDACRWCDPPSVDVRVRRALVWDDAGSAHTFSNMTGYLAAPVLAVGITAVTAITAEDAGWGRLIDDTIPVLETVAISQAVTQVVKFSVGRQRPFVHFGEVEPAHDHNLSFYSGHSALAFGLVTSAGVVAHWRRSPLEPVIWAAGVPLAAATAYLRIAGDRHYFTDVLVGSVVGVASGLTIPYLMRRHDDVAIVPSANGVSIAGAF